MQEIAQLQGVGHVFLQDLGIIICQAILYGVYLTLSAVALFSLCNRGLKTKPTFILFVALIAVLAASTVVFASNSVAVATMMRGYLVDHTEQPLEERFQLVSSEIHVWDVVYTWFAGLNQGIIFWVGDFVVVWRACVMFPLHLKTKRALAFLFLCSILLFIPTQILNSIQLQHNIASTYSGEILLFLQLICSIISVLVNAIATALIARQTYKHRQLLKKSLGDSESKTLTIMNHIAESGALYCIVQIICLALNVTDKSSLTTEDRATRIWTQISLFATEVYPVAVILLVNHHRSIADTPGLRDTLSNIHTIRFGNSGVPTTRDNTDSQFVDNHIDRSGRSATAKYPELRRNNAPVLEKGRRLVRSCP